VLSQRAMEPPVIQPRPNVSREGFMDNATVFGGILRGEMPTTILYEDERVLCFRDIRPVSTHHSLVIPKRLIPDTNHLTKGDVPLLLHMMHVAKRVIGSEYTSLDVEAAIDARELSIGFHRWPAISVHHLHMHVIYPMPASTWWLRWLHPKEYSFLYLAAEAIIRELNGSDVPCIGPDI